MKVYSFIFLFMAALNLRAQNRLNKTPFLHKTEFSIGYYGNLAWDNGLNIGAEYLWKEKTRKKKRKDKTISKQFLFNGNIGYSTNFSNKTDNGLLSNFGITWRRTNPKGKQIHFTINPIGYYRSFLPQTYEVKGDKVSRVTLPGRSYYSPSFVLGIGKKRSEKRRSGWYFNLQYTMRTHYNAGTLPVITLQYGYRFNFNNKK